MLLNDSAIAKKTAEASGDLTLNLFLEKKASLLHEAVLAEEER